MSRVHALLSRLKAARQDYYGGQKPSLTDAEYDTLEDELVGLVEVADDSEDGVSEAKSFLASIGAQPAGDSGWAKVRHAAPMGSLNKSQTVDDIQSWYGSCTSVGFSFTGGHNLPNCNLVVSDKCDGISISLQYRNGDLFRALTRGDGEEGEDITRNVVKMKGVKTKIPGFSGHTRGEIVLRRSDWKAHFPTYSNPRNAAAGIAKRLDGVGSEHLTVLHYQLLRDGAAPIPRKEIEFQALQKIGCATPTYHVVTTLDDVLALYESYVTKDREALDYDIDGLVVEFDDIALMEALGDLNKRPKGATAFKFPHDAKQTTLRAVRWQVGKSGRLTPVAEFDEINLAGVRVKQASLHNLARVKLLRLFIGCRILVSRRNDVIPMVEANLDEGVNING